MVKRNYSPPITAQALMDTYTEARRRAGTVGDGMPCIGYSNGWFTIGYGKYRRADVLAMIDNLNARIAAGEAR